MKHRLSIFLTLAFRVGTIAALLLVAVSVRSLDLHTQALERRVECQDNALHSSKPFDKIYAQACRDS